MNRSGFALCFSVVQRPEVRSAGGRCLALAGLTMRPLVCGRITPPRLAEAGAYWIRAARGAQARDGDVKTSVVEERVERGTADGDAGRDTLSLSSLRRESD